MGIAAAANQMSALVAQIKRAREEQEKILSNAQKLDSLQGSGGISGQNALQGGQLQGAGATALPGDPGGLKALFKSAFRAIAGGNTNIASTGSGGGGGVNASAGSSRSAPGIRGTQKPRFNINEILPNDQTRPFFNANPFNQAILQVMNGIRSDLQKSSLQTASTRSSR